MYMKIKYGFFLLLLLPLFPAACSNAAKENLPATFEISLPEGPYTAATQDIECTVTCEMEWTARLKHGSWVRVSRPRERSNEARYVTLSLSLNESEELRKDTLVLQAGDAVREVEIRQDGLSSLISPRTLVLEGTEPQTVRIHAPGQWRLRVPGSTNWLALSEKEGGSDPLEVTLRATEPFIGVDSRTVELSFVSTVDQIPLTVTQLQTDAIEVPENTFSFDFKGGTFKLEALYNVDYEMILPEGAGSWLTCVDDGMTKSLLSRTAVFSVARNLSTEAHAADIILRGSDLEQRVTVTQTGADPILDQALPGIYHLGGDWVFDKKKDQLSRTYRDGKLTFGLYSPSEECAVHLSGIPTSGLEPGLEFPLTLSQNRDLTLPARQTFQAYVLRVEGGMVWLSSDKEAAFIVKL